MEQKSYLELLNQSEQELEEQEKNYQLEDAEEQLLADLKATQRALTAAKREYPQVVMGSNFSTESILNKKREIEDLENGVKAIEGLREELFPTKKK